MTYFGVRQLAAALVWRSLLHLGDCGIPSIVAIECWIRNTSPRLAELRETSFAHKGASKLAHSCACKRTDRRGESLLQADALRPITDCNCVAVRRGGRQQEVNDPSVG
jgi:hypothetical protein